MIAGELPDSRFEDLSPNEIKKVHKAEQRLNDDQWNLFHHLLDKGESVRNAFQSVISRYDLA